MNIKEYMLNNKGLSIRPCRTTKAVSSDSLYDEFCVLSFVLDRQL